MCVSRVQAFILNECRSCGTKRWFSKGGSSKRWMERHTNDHFVRDAVKNDYRSRSAFKLADIQSKHRIITRSDFVVDLGSSPGGWSIIAAKSINAGSSATASYPSPAFFDTNTKRANWEAGMVLAVDLLPMAPIPGVSFVLGDFNASSTRKTITDVFLQLGRRCNVVLSDMLHNTTGNKAADHHRSIELCQEVLDFSCRAPFSFVDDSDSEVNASPGGQALDLCEGALMKGGHLLCKLLQGSDDRELVLEARQYFRIVSLVKPEASRAESREIYMLCRDKLT